MYLSAIPFLTPLTWQLRRLVTTSVPTCDGAWLVPKRWNQGGYDAAQILPASIRFVQVTRAQTHSLKLTYMRALISALVGNGRSVQSVDIVVVVPAGQCHEFQVGNVESHLREWSWSKEHVRIAGLKRSR